MIKKTALVMTSESLTSTVNDCKEVYLNGLFKEGIITKEQEDIMNQYCIVITDKGFFGRFWDKILFKKDTDDKIIQIIKMIK